MTDKLRDAAQQAMEAYCRGWHKSFAADNPYDRISITDESRKHILAGLVEALTALAQQDAQNAADEVWRKLFWQAALKLKCLPSSYPDANGHVLRAIDRLMGSENAQQDAQAELPIIRQNKLLADALASCILASGIVRTDIDGLTGPQLLLFAEDLREMLETKKAQQDAQTVPNGWKLVPVEPTPEMCNPSGDVGIVAEMAARYRREIWESMLNAAPTPTAQEKQS